MPLIPYKCDSCDHEFEIIQGYQDKRKKKCPVCKKNTLRQVFCAPYITGEIKSMGSLAEKNTREMGKYGLEERYRKDAIERDAVKLESLKQAGVIKHDATELPKTENTLKKLKNVLPSKAKTKKYIEEGKL
jgi:putative FmdB family regulatory protein